MALHCLQKKALSPDSRDIEFCEAKGHPQARRDDKYTGCPTHVHAKHSSSAFRNGYSYRDLARPRETATSLPARHDTKLHGSATVIVALVPSLVYALFCFFVGITMSSMVAV